MARVLILLGTVAIALLPFGLGAQPTIKIASPASDLVVLPGQTIDVQVLVSGPYSLVYLSGPSTTITVPYESLESPPYVLPRSCATALRTGPIHDNRVAVHPEQGCYCL